MFVSGIARAATPLATDDTGVTEKGVWEFSVFTTGEGRSSGDSYELPVVEIETGVLDNVSVFIEGARQVVDNKGESSSSGWGNAAIGAKWRFYDEDGVKIVLAPSYSTPINTSSIRRGLVEDVSILSVPLVASYESGKWIFTGQLAYDMTSTSVDGVGYGFWTGYQANDRWLLLAEIYGEELSGADEDGVTNGRLGFEYGLGFGTLLFSVGTRLASDLPSEDKLDYEFFLGYSWETG
jgi:hypothetical protein